MSYKFTANDESHNREWLKSLMKQYEVGGFFSTYKMQKFNVVQNLHFMKLISDEMRTELRDEENIDTLVEYYLDQKEFTTERTKVCAWDVDGTLTMYEGRVAQQNKLFFDQIDETKRQKLIRPEARDFIRKTHDKGVKHVVLSKGGAPHIRSVLNTLLGDDWFEIIDIHSQARHDTIERDERGSALVVQVALLLCPDLVTLYCHGVYETSVRWVEKTNSNFDFLLGVGKKLLERGLVEFHAFDDSAANIANIASLFGETHAHQVQANSQNESLSNHFDDVLQQFDLCDSVGLSNNNNNQVSDFKKKDSFFNNELSPRTDESVENSNNNNLA